MGFSFKFLLFTLMLNRILQEVSTYDTKKLKISPITRYVVDNKVCNIPYFEPWAFKEYYENKSYISCSSESPYVYLKYKEGKVYAVLNETINFFGIECCVSNIERNNGDLIPDNSFRETECVHINNGSIEVTHDVIRTICFKFQRDTKLQVYEDVHASYVSYNLEEKPISSGNTGFNVLMIVIDSLSQPNFKRLLPKTHTLLRQRGYVYLKAYGQVGKDALSNTLPLLTGYSYRLTKLKFGNPSKTFLDNYNFVWKDFANNGYVTAYAEDYSEKQSFNDNVMGFNRSPTTYYFRSYTLSADKLYTTFLDGMPHCTGPTLAAERILKLALDLVTTFRNRNYFGLFWMNTFSRYDFNAPGRMDNKLEEFFKTLHGYLENTIVFFLSDNGYFGDEITKNIYGWFESRTPFNYVYLPESFKSKHVDKHTLFSVNVKKLISPYDIYASLQDILEISRNNYTAKAPRSCKNCMSIFKSIPEARTCKEAGIDPYWCTCLYKKHIPFEFTNESSGYFVDV